MPNYKKTGVAVLINKLGEKIRTLRKSHRLTQQRLAELSDSSVSMIWNLEHRSRSQPSAEKLFKIAEQLDVTIDYLIDDLDTISEEDAHFCHRYLHLDAASKARVRQMASLCVTGETAR